MQRLIQLLLLSCGFSLAFGWTQAVFAKPALETIEETGVLTVGVRDDSPLFGYGDDNSGYCKDFADNLAGVLTENLGKTIQVKLVTSTTQNRWDLVKDGTVQLECGPNTITAEREQEYGIKFSQPFFVTASQIFVKSDITEEDVKTGTIGTINGTTNAMEIQQVYPDSQTNDTYTNREQGIEAVQSGEITGFASDGILLVGTATVLQLDLNSFALATPVVNERPFCAAYGMILPGGEENTEWVNTVDALVDQKGEGGQIWARWFKELSPYIDQVINSCQPQ